MIVRLDSSLTPTAQVVDLVSGAATDLPAGSAHIKGRTVTVQVPGSLLPSTGLAPVAVPIQLLARGWRTARLRLGSQLRARVHHGAGRDGSGA